MEKSIKNILCCIGLRGDCHMVLEQAAGLALDTGASLHVLHAIKSLDDDVMNVLRVNIRDGDALGHMMQRRVAEARLSLEEKVDAFCLSKGQDQSRYAAIIKTREVAEGYPAKVIVNRASRLDCDLIVIAANKKGMTVSYVGKVARGVLKRSPIPVVVVPPQE